jgi:hypothetical protein
MSSEDIYFSEDLWNACERGDSEEVHEFLLRNDTRSINLPNENQSGQTLLFIASQRGHLQVVKILLSCRDILIDAIEKTGKTPLMAAVPMDTLKLPDCSYNQGQNHTPRMTKIWYQYSLQQLEDTWRLFDSSCPSPT